MKITVDKAYAEERGWPWTAHEIEIIDQRRWVTVRRGIVEMDGHYYWITWEQGSTEAQEIYPWEDQDTVELTEIHQVEKTVLVWEAVP